MEALVASGVGAMTAAGVYLILRARSFPVIVGLAMLSYAVNVFLFATGRLALDLPPVISKSAEAYTDPLPQALVLTAIVISFGMTAVIVVLALRAYLESGDDAVDIGATDSESADPPPDDPGDPPGEKEGAGR
ncbi:MAG: Na+/H+ antiporter subunit C [Marivibrio sp.]|uniref:Na+/H+ antiporter subunit C n=1 Tax=Marivibrio sp. TaxID=2039719 RepID=UPI0032EB2DFF